jgi:chitin synthase
MSFFQRVLFNDRLSELDYEIFWKMTWLMKGVTPDKFELVLMVQSLILIIFNLNPCSFL